MLGSTTTALLCAALCGNVHATTTIGGSDDLFFGPGTIGIGPQGCLVFSADDGQSFFFNDAQGFFPGERAFIVGTIEDESLMCFPFIGTALRDAILRPIYEACGTLALAPQGCLALIDDETGESVFVQNTGGFVPGDRVCILGGLEEESDLCFPIIGRAVLFNEISRLFEGCGELALAPQGCIAIHADSGEILALGDVDGFLPGDRVFVTGGVDEQSLLCFPADVPAIPDNTIEACAPIGDLDGDGDVSVTDLLILLDAWGNCPAPPAECPADFDGTDTVDVADLLVLLSNWT
jgi:hypothetical protein